MLHMTDQSETSIDWSQFLKWENHPLEIGNLEVLSGLRDLLSQDSFRSQGPHLLIAEEEEIKKFRSFLKLKPLKDSCFQLPPFSLGGGGGVSERLIQKRRGWQSQARYSSGLFIASPQSLLKKTSLKVPLLELKEGASLPNLASLGYKPEEFVLNPGDFSRRGFICDVFSPAYSTALRLELTGDQITSLHLLDASGKNRKETLTSALLPFTGEWLPRGELQKLCRFLKKEGCGREALQTLARGNTPFGFEILRNALEETCSLDWFAHSPWIWVYESDILKKRFAEVEEEFSRLPPPFRFKSVYLPWGRLEKERLIYLNRGSSQQFPFPSSSVSRKVWSYPCRRIQKPLEKFLQTTKPSLFIWVHPKSSKEAANSKENTNTFNIQNLNNPLNQSGLDFESVSSVSPEKRNSHEDGDFQEKPQSSNRIGINQKEWKSAAEFSQNSFLQYIKNRLPDSVSQNSLFIEGQLEESFVNSSEGEAWLKPEDLEKKKSQRGPSTEENSFEFFRQKAEALNFSELKEGELVVHRKHGLGKFSKLQALDMGEVSQDFIVLTYKEGDRLLLPAYRANEIKRYASYFPKNSEALLDRLGDPRRWEKKKEKVAKHIQALTMELIEIYRRRRASRRPPFKPVSEELKKFAEGFPFTETAAQLKAISEIMKDMDREYPMERLISADVGFGKTEVALRAVFRALENGFQVCWIVPTTVLSLQHYENFKARFQGWPFRLALLNRFLSQKGRDKLLKKLQQGEVDFLIATHGVFNSSVFFKNPGLFVIDEEHRFGVSQKEKLNRLKSHLDILSLSATPIPRTLNMALSGIRDVSLIGEPPARRKSVQIFTKKWDPALIRKACDFEKKRGGQILFVHNRVKSIYEREQQLRAILPHYKIGLATGQMPPAQLENILIQFFDGKFDLLLSTNIIESGMDIPEANTLFIDRISTLGLSQLYQLKGRVGRGETQAYCYFLLPERGKIAATARERLRLMEQYGDLGGGFHLALHDMETRGAGELFGARQSGFINTVGQEFYFELLRESLSRESEKETLFPEPEIKLPLSSYIPSSYIPDDPLRLFYYKSLSEASSKTLAAIRSEMEHNFGVLPPETLNLFSLLEIRKTGRRLGLREMKTVGDFLYLSFQEKAALPVESILKAIQNRGWKMRTEHSIKIPLDSKKDLFEQVKSILMEFSLPG